MFGFIIACVWICVCVALMMRDTSATNHEDCDDLDTRDNTAFWRKGCVCVRFQISRLILLSCA